MMEGLPEYDSTLLVAGCDEAGRGCLAGPVYAAAVIFPRGYSNPRINDSKKLSEKERYLLAEEIRHDALAWGVNKADAGEIDSINILQASILAMHRALDALQVPPEYIIVDGNRFKPYRGLPHTCFIKGDSRFLSIAAASILAKTSRDDFMRSLHEEFPEYGWNTNKGYPSPKHIRVLMEYGPTPYHRHSFHVKGQLSLQFP